MKIIRNFLLACIGLFFISAFFCAILKITFKQFVIYCVIGVVLYFAFIFAIDLIKNAKAQKQAKPDAAPQPPAAAPAAVPTQRPSFSCSTDSEDYDYAYSHVGLFRPSETPGPRPPVGTDVIFKEEPDNPYDADAVKAVWFYNGEERLAGYFYRSDDTIREMARDWINRGDDYYATITDDIGKLRLFIGFNR